MTDNNTARNGSEELLPYIYQKFGKIVPEAKRQEFLNRAIFLMEAFVEKYESTAQAIEAEIGSQGLVTTNNVSRSESLIQKHFLKGKHFWAPGGDETIRVVITSKEWTPILTTAPDIIRLNCSAKRLAEDIFDVHKSLKATTMGAVIAFAEVYRKGILEEGDLEANTAEIWDEGPSDYVIRGFIAAIGDGLRTPKGKSFHSKEEPSSDWYKVVSKLTRECKLAHANEYKGHPNYAACAVSLDFFTASYNRTAMELCPLITDGQRATFQQWRQSCITSIQNVFDLINKNNGLNMEEPTSGMREMSFTRFGFEPDSATPLRAC